MRNNGSNMSKVTNASGPLALSEQPDNASLSNGQKIAALGGIVAALVASSCCIVPVALFSLGISGAWIGNLTQLAPYQPYFLAAALLCLGAGYWLSHRSSKRACAAGEACAQPLPNRLVKGMLLIATVLVVAAIAFDLLAPLLLNS